MKIAICTGAPDGPECIMLAKLMHRCAENAEVLICEFEEIFYGNPPQNTDAAFVCIEDMRSLEGARKLHLLGIPLVVVSDSPDYAMEGIRLGVRHYIIRPVSEPEIQTALRRLGILIRSDAQAGRYR